MKRRLKNDNVSIGAQQQTGRDTRRGWQFRGIFNQIQKAQGYNSKVGQLFLPHDQQ